MFDVTESWIMPVNIGIGLLFLIFIVKGYKEGILRQVIAFVGTAGSFYAAWLGASVIGKYFMIVPDSWASYVNSFYQNAAEHYLNMICWFVLLFIICRLVFVMIGHMVKVLQKVPGVAQLSGLAGGAVGAAEAAVVVTLLTIVVTLPAFNNGQILAERTIAAQVNDVTGMVFHDFVEPVLHSEAFSNLGENASELTHEQKNALEKWLIENGYINEADALSAIETTEYTAELYEC